jgi:hypothetical protein
MSKESIKDKFSGLLNLASMGNADAVSFMVDTFYVAHIWDDLIDRDKPLSDAMINQAFITMMVSIPRNRFYVEHIDRLSMFIERSIVDWLVATQWEKRGITKQQAEIAYITRSSYTQLITEVALIVGGFAHGFQVQELVRLEMHDQGLDEYYAECLQSVQGE